MQMARGLPLIVAALIAAPASAQTAHTHCESSFGLGLDCTTRAEPQQNLNAGAEAAENLRRMNHEDAAERGAWTRRKVGRLIADGRCEDAKRAALRSGDLDLAANVATICRPTPER